MTMHNEAKKEDIAKTVIMPGDPMRAKYIAETYLTNYKLVNSIRCMYAYTGYYKGKLVTIMAHGMGIPSASIYIYELFKFYDVEKIIRIGSAGSLDEEVKTLDIVLATSSYSPSNFCNQFNNEECHLVASSEELTNHIEKVSNNIDIKVKKGIVYTSDVFDVYTNIDHILDNLEIKPIASEMESFVLFYLAKMLNKKAACLLTIVDSKFEKINISAEDRQLSLNNMITLALESIL